MVLVERNSENVRNGRRSRGPSPNGHGGTPDSSSDDDSSKKIGNKSAKTKSEYEEKIRVGRDYQVVCPDLVAAPDRKPETLNDRALLVWSPTKDIPESKLEEYISVAKEKYGYNGEQALGMLFWHKHDLERAVLDLANFTPFPDEWTVEDKVLFEQAFQFHGKSFHRIRQMLPDKSIASLVKYYYSWKKTRSRTSVMDRQEKIKTKEGSENGSENGSNEESDSEEKKWPFHRGICRASGSPPLGTNDEHAGSSGSPNQAAANAAAAAGSAVSGDAAESKGMVNGTSETAVKIAIGTGGGGSSISACFGCGVACSITNVSPHGALCNSCFHHWRRTGSLRPTTGPFYGKRSRGTTGAAAAGSGGGGTANANAADRHKRKPPRGMYINHDDIVALASPENEQTAGRGGGGGGGDDLLASMDREINTLLSQIQNNKQAVSILKRRHNDSYEDLKPAESANRINTRWNNEELQLAVQGVRKCGKDFRTIAEMIGTKTETQVRTFFVNYRRRYNLDSLLKEFEEAKQQLQLQQQQLEAAEAAREVGATATAAASVVTATAAPPRHSTAAITTTTSAAETAAAEPLKHRAAEPEIMEIDLDEDVPTPPPAATTVPSSASVTATTTVTPITAANGSVTEDDDIEEVMITDPIQSSVPVTV